MTDPKVLRAMADAVEYGIALGKLDAPAVFTKMRDLLNLALLARTEAGACPECGAPGLLVECVACSHSTYPPKDAAPVVDGAVALDRCQPCKGSGIVEGGGPYGTPSNCTECHGSGMAIVGDVYAMHEAHTNVAKGRDMPIRRMEAAALVVHDRIRARLTHPQDASGDAIEAQRYRWLRDEASRAQLEMFADRRGTRLAADRLCDAGIDIAAMQAKEAK